MTTDQQCELKNLKKELLFYYESRQNPNGDPGFENQPRLMSDGTIMVTDVRIKRTIRDYAKNKYGVTLFSISVMMVQQLRQIIEQKRFLVIILVRV
jgi:Cas7 group CRISPR-associated protein Csh2